MQDEVFTEVQAAGFLKCSRSFLRQARMRGDGPIFCYLSPRAVRYRRADLEAYLNERMAQNTLYPSRGSSAKRKTGGAA